MNYRKYWRDLLGSMSLRGLMPRSWWVLWVVAVLALTLFFIFMPISAHGTTIPYGHTVQPQGYSTLQRAQLKAVPPVSQTCQKYGTLASGYRGEYVVQNNEWNSDSPQCVATYGGTSWAVTANQNVPLNGPPASYPSVFKGSHWGQNTINSGLPLQVSKLTSVTSSWSTSQPDSGAYDVAYDIWFNSTSTTSGQPDGTELMIWLNSRGQVQPFGSLAGTTPGYKVWHGTAPWQVVTYQATTGVPGVSSLDVLGFIKDAAARGYVNPSHYLITAEAGFEIWQGGTGLATNSFSFYAKGV